MKTSNLDVNANGSEMFFGEYHSEIFNIFLELLINFGIWIQNFEENVEIFNNIQEFCHLNHQKSLNHGWKTFPSCRTQLLKHS